MESIRSRIDKPSKKNIDLGRAYRRSPIRTGELPMWVPMGITYAVLLIQSVLTSVGDSMVVRKLISASRWQVVDYLPDYRMYCLIFYRREVPHAFASAFRR
ncbi:hypothetical protein HAX54_038773 [Datura stramonium]|uniref:Uncharacterized protein n=1 Tax=Datura stramonium TaxID=4076 RepID=A0ABS8VLL2_DATST|nr:hypothetical protein [Datura stramonium]